jgi:hypothetical protein
MDEMSKRDEMVKMITGATETTVWAAVALHRGQKAKGYLQ